MSKYPADDGAKPEGSVLSGQKKVMKLFLVVVDATDWSMRNENWSEKFRSQLILTIFIVCFMCQSTFISNTLQMKM